VKIAAASVDDDHGGETLELEGVERFFNVWRARLSARKPLRDVSNVCGDNP
jgi:hypothetical protein